MVRRAKRFDRRSNVQSLGRPSGTGRVQLKDLVVELRGKRGKSARYRVLLVLLQTAKTLVQLADRLSNWQQRTGYLTRSNAEQASETTGVSYAAGNPKSFLRFCKLFNLNTGPAVALTKSVGSESRALID